MIATIAAIASPILGMLLVYLVNRKIDRDITMYREKIVTGLFGQDDV